MMLSFSLSMPRVGSWDNQWSGRNRCYVLARAVTKSKEWLAGQYFTYDFGDGWRAGVKVETISPKQAKAIRRHTDGFCGYDWMVDEILTHGRILSLAERKKEKAA